MVWSMKLKTGMSYLLSADQKVGGGLLPIAVHQSVRCRLSHRYREQAPSHISYISQS